MEEKVIILLCGEFIRKKCMPDSSCECQQFVWVQKSTRPCFCDVIRYITAIRKSVLDKLPLIMSTFIDCGLE